MNQLQEKLLIMYIEIKEIFEKNNIQFTAIGGTAIGAMREGGFLEWDDDIDLLVKEEDFEKIELSLENTKYSLVNERMGFTAQKFLKIYDNSILISDNGAIKPLNIDIFIAYKTRIWRNSDYKQIKRMCFILRAKGKRWRDFDWNNMKGGHFGYWILGKMFFSVNPKKLSKKIFNKILALEVDEKVSENIRCDYGSGFKDKYDLSSHKVFKFENTTVPVNTSFAKDTIWRFGDIMVKPSVEKRYNHETYLINSKKKKM